MAKPSPYRYDAGNRLDDVTDWNSRFFDYSYDDANRLDTLALPNGLSSDYDYDPAGRLTLLTHATLTDTLAHYAYGLDELGNRTTLTETLLVPDNGVPGAYLESGGLVVLEMENATQVISNTTHTWQLSISQSGYTGTGYLQGLPDIDGLYQTAEITAAPTLHYPIDFTTPGTYTLWLRGYPTNAAGDSLYAELDGHTLTVTGFAPGTWGWANQVQAEGVAEINISQSGLYTLSLSMREDGIRLDRLLLTTDTTYLPTGFGPVESVRQTSQTTGTLTTLVRTIAYTYDDRYRLTAADYTSGETYSYTYDPAGNRLQQVIGGDTATTPMMPPTALPLSTAQATLSMPTAPC